MISIKEFEDLLVFEENQKNTIEELKREKLPLILWGAGDIASAVNQYLEINGIVPTIVWVDQAEGGIKEENFEGIPIATLDKIKEKYDEFNVIIGHSHYDLGDEILQREPQIRRVYYFVSVSYEQYENISAQFVKDNIKAYYNSFCCLEDEESRCAMTAYLNARMNGDIHYVKRSFRHKQNFFNNDIFHIGQNESFLDVGAFDGDTIYLFLQECEKKYDEIFAFEPDDSAFIRLQAYVENEDIKNVSLFQTGTWNKEGTLYFATPKEAKNQSASVSVTEAMKQIRVNTLDNMLKHRVTMLKINFLYGVLETLVGAQNILERDKPKLAVVVGFDEWALINIPQYIKKIVPEYQLYLRYNRCMPAALTLYAKNGGNETDEY